MTHSKLCDKIKLVSTVREVFHGDFVFRITTDASGSTVKFTTVNPQMWGHGFLTKYFTIGNSVTSQIHARKENIRVFCEFEDALKAIEVFVEQ